MRPATSCPCSRPGPLAFLALALFVAGIRLAEDGDEVIAALPLTGATTEALLSISEKGWKVTASSDIPVKGRGGGGVGFHPFVTGEDTLMSVSLSPNGFRRGANYLALDSGCAWGGQLSAVRLEDGERVQVGNAE